MASSLDRTPPRRHQELEGAVLDRELAQSILTSSLRQTGQQGSSCSFRLLAVHTADSRVILSVHKG